VSLQRSEQEIWTCDADHIGLDADRRESVGGLNRIRQYVGICGQGPSDHPDLADWLVEQGIESMSLNPDTVVETWLRLAKREPVLAPV
jgi:phosphoenolpyruvate synthase/pyruvate phosphate dikinase